jgi:hypothetical protein
MYAQGRDLRVQIPACAKIPEGVRFAAAVVAWHQR